MAEVGRAILQAAESFSIHLPDGTPFVVVAGDRFYADDQVVKGREHLFGELAVRSSAPQRSRGTRTAAAVETADATPGKARTVTRKGPANA